MNRDDVQKSISNVNKILNSKPDIKETEFMPSDENRMTYENGVWTDISAMFVDIRKSTEYFKNTNPERVARVMRAFVSEVIGILRANKNCHEIGIRGDCVYAIYSTPKKEDLKDVLKDAGRVNSFQKTFQEILFNRKWENFEIGIGLGTSKDLVIKAGAKYTGINDFIWIGDAVIDASNLSGKGNNEEGFDTVVMSEAFYDKVMDQEAMNGQTYGDVFKLKTYGIADDWVEIAYHYDLTDPFWDFYAKRLPK